MELSKNQKQLYQFKISRKCCEIAAISHDSRTPAYSNLEKIRKKEIREILEDLSGDSRH